MSKNRIALIEQAFKKLDKTGDGVVTVADMEGIYDHRKHPQFVSGEKTKDEVFKMFLANFETRGNVDGKVKVAQNKKIKN
jgi:Ca2+-binding EF-hand superfamily protein